jgi:hypothetical protein
MDLFEKTHIYMFADDVYIAFPYSELTVLPENDFHKIKFDEAANIVIDCRLDNAIMYAVSKIDDNVLIYDIYKYRIISIYNFVKETYKLFLYDFDIDTLKKFSQYYLLFNHTFRHFPANFNPQILLQNLVTKATHPFPPNSKNKISSSGLTKAIRFLRGETTDTSEINQSELCGAITIRGLL